MSQKRQLKEEVVRAIQTLEGKGKRFIFFEDIQAQIKEQRVLDALLELEREGKVVRSPQGWRAKEE